MTLLEHLNRGGCIRFNRYTKKIVLVYDSCEVKDVACSEANVWDLLQNKICDFYPHNSHEEGNVMVISRADKDVSISQRDREVFQTILSHWNDTNGGLPGNCSYQDLFDLCDKIEVPRPDRVIEFLNWAEGQRAEVTQD